MCGSQFSNKTVGLVGFGRIGFAVAKRLLPFNVSRILFTTSSNTTVHSQFPKETQEIISTIDEVGKRYFQLSDGIHAVPLNTLVSESDIIIICCSLNENTKGLFHLEVFESMKRSALLVNIARGGIVKTSDLETALRTGLIHGAALDVVS
jgi:glyoxylate/hydroxypyruvate reductase